MAICPVCGAEIEDWISRCSSCKTLLEWEHAPTNQVWTDEEEYYGADRYFPRRPRINRSIWLIPGGLIVALFAFVCVCCFALVIAGFLLFQGESPTVAQATAMPAPIAPPFEQICSQMQTMTEAQWEQYTQELSGTRAADWAGWVEDVNKGGFEGYELWIDMDPPDEPFSVQEVQIGVPEDLALQLRKDQQVTFSGTIDSVMNALGSCQVTLKDATVTPLEEPVTGG